MGRSTSTSLKRRQSRSRVGVAPIEVAIAAFSVIVIVGLAIDATIFVMAFVRLDQATRDATRAAANQPKSATDAPYPSTACAAALQAAQSQMNQHPNDGTFIKQPYLTGTTSPYFVYQDWGGYTPGPPATNQCPYVQVTCSEQVLLPLQIHFFGFTTQGFSSGGSTITMTRKYIFPIVKMASYVPSS